YGPATVNNLSYWLTEGLGVPRRELLGWVEDLGAAITRVQVDDDDALVLTEHVEEIARTSPSDTVHLLPGYDPWVMGPGRADARIVPPKHRAIATKSANLAIRGGRVRATWRARGDDVVIDWFDGAGR